MSATLLIEGKVLGQKRPLFDDFRIDLPPQQDEPGGGRLTLRALIDKVVREQVAVFQRQQAEHRLDHVLSQAQIDRGLMKGRVSPEGKELQQDVDVEEAVGAALLAFEDGIYYIFIDEQQQTSLDSEVYLQPQSKVTFLRLVALAGG